MANNYKDYYKILGLDKASDAAQIKKAYRKLARQYHPDVNPDNAQAGDKFREVTEAYDVLGNEEKRKLYDKYGQHYGEYENWKKAGGEATGVPFEAYINGIAAGVGRTPPRNRGSYQYNPTGSSDFQDLFGEDSPFSDYFYNNYGANPNMPRGNRPMRGRDLEYNVQVTLEEAFSGAKRLLQVAGEPGKPARKLEVSIPAGVTDGSKVRLANLGTAGRFGGPAGDLFLLVEVAPHPQFERRGADLYSKVNLPVQTAILGGEIHVPTIKGNRLALKVAAGSQSGTQLRLRGQGMPVKTNGEERGDLYVQLQITVPTDLDDEEQAALENFARLLQNRDAHKSKGGVA